MDCSTPDFPVLLRFPELAWTHVHWVGDAIQPSRPLSPPSLPAFNLSQHQGLFQWVDFSHHEKGEFRHTDRHAQKVDEMKKCGRRWHQQVKERETCNRSSSHSPQKEPILWTPWFLTCSLQNCKAVNLCCVNYAVYGTLLWQLEQMRWMQKEMPKPVYRLRNVTNKLEESIFRLHFIFLIFFIQGLNTGDGY